MTWHRLNSDKTLGKTGSEEGGIIFDIEYGNNARITIEQDGVTTPFAVTMGIYGVMVHTEFFATLEQVHGYQSKIMPTTLKIIEFFDVDEGERGEVWKSTLNELIDLIVRG